MRSATIIAGTEGLENMIVALFRLICLGLRCWETGVWGGDETSLSSSRSLRGVYPPIGKLRPRGVVGGARHGPSPIDDEGRDHESLDSSSVASASEDLRKLSASDESTASP